VTDQAEKRQVGRPLKFQSVEELEARINAFFAECDAQKIPYTITGLALALDTSRELLREYEQRDEFVDTIKRAKTKVENYAEQRLYSGSAAAGPIFALKNFGWADTQNHNHGGQPDNPVQTVTKIVIEAAGAAEQDDNGTDSATT
jgi:hypothetical protein